MLCGWEGNHKLGVALSMRHRLIGVATCGLSGNPPMLSSGVPLPTPLPLLYATFCLSLQNLNSVDVYYALFQLNYFIIICKGKSIGCRTPRGG